MVNTLAVAANLHQEPFRRLTTGKELTITIYGDNDFYSQREEVGFPCSLTMSTSHCNAKSILPQLKAGGLSLSSESSKTLPRFNRFHRTFDAVAKTGLGSSAALVTSLVGSLLQLFEVVNLDGPHASDKNRTTVHNLAQFCHCLAQGKIGSGFDVASAVFGSLQYRRFSPTILEDLLNKVALIQSSFLSLVLAYLIFPFFFASLKEIQPRQLTISAR